MTSPCGLGYCDGHFSQFSNVLWTNYSIINTAKCVDFKFGERQHWHQITNQYPHSELSGPT